MKLLIFFSCLIQTCFAQSRPSYTSSSISSDSSWADTRDGRANFTGSQADTRDGRANFTGSQADTRDGRANFTGSQADTRDGRANFTGSQADTRDGRANYTGSQADTRDGRANYDKSMANYASSFSKDATSYAPTSSHARSIRSQTSFVTSSIASSKVYAPNGQLIPFGKLVKGQASRAVTALQALRATNEGKCLEFTVTTAVPAGKLFKGLKRGKVVTAFARARSAQNAVKLVQGLLDTEGMQACWSVVTE